MTKRALDIVVSFFALVLALPLLAIIALLVKMDSRGPILFRQRRLGRRFHPFLIYKFRTMAVDAANSISVGDDRRVTRIGRVLRRAKLDELPQLFNVLKGEMSLVGPRPELPEFVELYREEYAEILAVRPGLTDLASIKYRNEAALLEVATNPQTVYVGRILPDKIRLGREYVRRSSIGFDLSLIARTLPRVAGQRDAGMLRGTRRPATARLDGQEKRRQPRPSQLDGGTGLLADVILGLPREFRRALVVVVHLLLAAVSTYLAFSLRFDGAIPGPVMKMYVGTLLWMLTARGATFFLFRLDEGIWRYVGLWDLRRIAAAVFTSTVVSYLFIRYGYGTDDYPRSVFLIDSALLLILMGAFRLSPRVYRELARPRGKRRLLIVGAGDTGERMLRQIQHDPSSLYEPVGFVDDDPGKVGQRMHGVPVLGTVRDLPDIVEWEALHEIMIAFSATAAQLREMVTMLGPYNVAITTVDPGTSGRGPVVNAIRSLSIEDLLSRPAVGLDNRRVEALIAGKRVLVTGAGGSIGSELSRQIAALGPECLVLFERYENGLYSVANTIQDGPGGAFVHPVIGDVTDQARLNAVFQTYRPQLVFHAAAHKHVPLMELNPCEAVKNNVMGTRMVAETAQRHGVERFIQISTDKAVNPSSVMGATKRVAELMLRRLSTRGTTDFVTVRFGNVLGSNGSVLLRFQDQVKAGGPVTVTHPEIKRFFMLIPEAVQLVLHAAAVGDGGDTLVLEMGEQIRVLDLARNVIRLSGRTPDKDIPIVFTGLRPGEKLFEEIAGAGEVVEPGAVDKILRIASSAPNDRHTAASDFRDLERSALDGDEGAVMLLLGRLVPTFRQTGSLQPQ
jgi:FlaA1/EpsC-like NDP-sugar epimerase/lipopolysaccharide/colanic/teichoic acid biosynthesis glycosyltransferase